MIRFKEGRYNSLYVAGLYFIIVLVYFILFNRYHFYYLEQIQLFRFRWDYFAEFLAKPGGVAEYSGAFITQFFLFPAIGPFIVTLTGLAVYFLSLHIFRKFNLHGVIWSFIPVLMLVALHSDSLYKPGYSIGLLMSLAYTAGSLSIQNTRIRYVAGFAGLLILYPITGLFSFLAPLLFLLDELFNSKNKYKYAVILGYLLSMILIPWLHWRYIYILPLSEAWLTSFNSSGNAHSRFMLALLVGFFPVMVVAAHLISSRLKQQSIIFNWDKKNMISGMILMTILSVTVIKNSAEPNTELLLRVDHDIQNSDWDNALEHCYSYPESNIIISYFTNLALLKSGHLGDKMFHYNQIGSSGLSLPWMNNNVIPLFGCEIYYQLGYYNEAYRWAFEAMEMNGQSPRLLKRLAMTSLINGDIRVAEKYLKQLEQSMYYRKWAQHYLELVNNPELLKLDKEICGDREFIIQEDFLAGADNSQLGLVKLLENHPHNKMAYEYYLAKLLLSKDMVTFVKEIGRLKELGYKEIPVHFEEAILWYIGYSKQNVIPEGFKIRNSTLQRFKDYSYSYAANKGSQESMKKAFGTTFWFYFHFINPSK